MQQTKQACQKMMCLFCYILACMEKDPWLEKWLDLIKQKSARGYVLELGCGSGWDTVDLLSTGCQVIATDMSMENLIECQTTARKAHHIQLNHGQLLPFATASMDVIIASLTLHYFSWTVTRQIASELRRCLKTDGILLARFNSTNDVNYGALSTEAIEPNLYQVGARTKRFFDETSIRTLFQDWDIQFFEENVIYRYEKPKFVWEVFAQP